MDNLRNVIIVLIIIAIVVGFISSNNNGNNTNIYGTVSIVCAGYESLLTNKIDPSAMVMLDDNGKRNPHYLIDGTFTFPYIEKTKLIVFFNLEISGWVVVTHPGKYELKIIGCKEEY